MAKILILSLVFPPDGVSTSILYGQLVHELEQLGHEIKVLTTTPHYNEDIEAMARQRLFPKSRGIYFESNFRGVKVYHVPMHKKESRIAMRIADYAKFHFVSTMLGLVAIDGYDIILSPSPPLTIGLSAWILAGARRVPFVYNVQEIFPDIAVSLGMLKNKKLIRFFEKIECFIYKKSQTVAVISEWFKMRLLTKGVINDKIAVIPNFTDTEFMKPGNRINEFSRKYNLEDKFVALYAGNIGLTQNFEKMLGAARRLSHLKDLCILIVGDGARSNWLENKLKNERYQNIRFLPYQPRSIIPEMYASSDICLVALKGGTAQETFPSKIYTIMAAGRPAVVSAEKDSDLAWLVDDSGCGWAVPADDEAGFADTIEYAYNNRAELDEKGECGRRYVEKYHSRKAVARQYDQLIRSILDKG